MGLKQIINGKEEDSWEEDRARLYNLIEQQAQQLGEQQKSNLDLIKKQSDFISHQQKVIDLLYELVPPSRKDLL